MQPNAKFFSGQAHVCTVCGLAYETEIALRIWCNAENHARWKRIEAARDEVLSIAPTKAPWLDEYNECRANSSRTGQGNETVFDLLCEDYLLRDFCEPRGLTFKRRGDILDADAFRDGHKVGCIEARIRLQPFQISYHTVIEKHKVDAMLRSGLPCVFLVEWPATGHQLYVKITKELIEASENIEFKRTVHPRPHQYVDTATCIDIPNRFFKSIHLRK